MATFNAIAAISSAILNILRESQPPAEFGTLEYQLYSANHFDGQGITSGYSLFLWRITMNSERRNLAPRRDSSDQVFRPSLPIDLHYLLTPWATDLQTQQRMLGWAMRTLEDETLLPAAILNVNLAETDTFSNSETVELTAEPLELTDLFNLWDKLSHNLNTSMMYRVRSVLIDSQQLLEEYPHTKSRKFKDKALT